MSKMDVRTIDMTGRRFGSWTVLRYAGVTSQRKTVWECRCDCGQTSDVQGGNLRSGKSTQCRDCGTVQAARKRRR